jgi:hypothetical protein
MSEISASSNSAGKTVVLVLPEALGDPDPEKLGATLVDPSHSVRVLLYLPDSTGHAFAATLAKLGIETEILLAPEVDVPETGAFYLHMLPGTRPQDQIEFALALSDVVLIAPEFEQRALAAAVRGLAKPIVAPGGRLPPIPPFIPITHHLDPELRGWLTLGRRIFGRFGQATVELLSSFGMTKGGVAQSLKRLRSSLVGPWRPTAYFAAEGWQSLAPDRATTGTLGIMSRFNELDRSASYGSHIYYDFIWIQYLCAASAVLLAVAGELIHGGPAWGLTELFTLLTIAFLVSIARYTRLQDRWLACRLSAELVRTAIMSLPLLVLPPALATPDMQPRDGHGLGFEALRQLKRVVRDHGLPRLDPSLTIEQAVAWLRLIIADQLSYYDRDYRKLMRLAVNIRIIKQLIFALGILAVLAHFFHHAAWLLLFTAAAPAFAAALHGAATRLGIMKRAPLSFILRDELKRIDAALAQLTSNLSHTTDDWRKVRRLAFDAATAFNQNIMSYYSVMRSEEELP